MSTTAFIGLGVMGSPMAVHVQRAGHDVLFEPGFRMELHHTQLMTSAVVSGDGGLDHSALQRGVERLNGRG